MIYKIMITGGKGMLGRTLQKKFAKHTLLVADLPDVDITDIYSLNKAFNEFKPDIVIHCAAMTNVDKCESDPETAFKLNACGTENVAMACKQHHAKLIAISTDYVFPGDEESPRNETDVPASPKTIYGQSKLAGENAVRKILPNDSIVLRIAWLYGNTGPSFIHAMTKLGRQAGEPLKVVDDQYGNPTSTDYVADEIDFLINRNDLWGKTIHGTCAGICSWYNLTCELFNQLGIVCKVVPCTTAEFPRPAPRPHWSALAKNTLDAIGYPVKHWTVVLKEFLQEQQI